MKNKKGVFVTFEGGEGSGKTTLINQLEIHFQNQGHAVLKTREPGGSELGEMIRKWLLEHDPQIKIGQKAELLLFLAARAQHIEQVIEPALKSGKIILCDRFNDSTIAYQGVARNLGYEYTSALCQQVCQEVVPDLTFYLDVDPQVGISRAGSRNHNAYDRIESENSEFHEQVRKGFQRIAKDHPQRMVILDANLSQNQVLENALQALKYHEQLLPHLRK